MQGYPMRCLYAWRCCLAAALRSRTARTKHTALRCATQMRTRTHAHPHRNARTHNTHPAPRSRMRARTQSTQPCSFSCKRATHSSRRAFPCVSVQRRADASMRGIAVRARCAHSVSMRPHAHANIYAGLYVLANVYTHTRTHHAYYYYYYYYPPRA